MRQWLPDERDVDLRAAYRAARWAPEGRAGIALDMVVGIDGGVTIDGRSGPIGGDADWTAFTALRDAADVVLVGAGTVREEDYGPPVRRDDVAEARRAEGRDEVPAMVIATRTLDLAPTMRAFSHPTRKPVVVCPVSAPADREAPLRDHGVEVLRFGEVELDLAAGRAGMQGQGWREVLCEGGPELNSALFRADLVDELFVSVAPKVTGSPRHLVDPDLLGVVDLDLVGVVHEAGELLLRYRVRR